MDYRIGHDARESAPWYPSSPPGEVQLKQTQPAPSGSIRQQKLPQQSPTPLPPTGLELGAAPRACEGKLPGGSGQALPHPSPRRQARLAPRRPGPPGQLQQEPVREVQNRESRSQRRPGSRARNGLWPHSRSNRASVKGQGPAGPTVHTVWRGVRAHPPRDDPRRSCTV